MAFERMWSAVAPQSFTADGTTTGLITVADTAGFRVKQSAYLKNTAGTLLPVQVKCVLSPTSLIVGLIDNKISNSTPLDISAWTVASGASIGAEIQNKSGITPEDIIRAIYEGDPVAAVRVLGIDEYGNPYTQSNPLPVTSGGAGGLTPSKYDDVKIIKNSNGDPTQYQFYLAGLSVGNINVFYDTFGASEYKKA